MKMKIPRRNQQLLYDIQRQIQILFFFCKSSSLLFSVVSPLCHPMHLKFKLTERKLHTSAHQLSQGVVLSPPKQLIAQETKTKPRARE